MWFVEQDEQKGEREGSEDSSACEVRNEGSEVVGRVARFVSSQTWWSVKQGSEIWVPSPPPSWC